MKKTFAALATAAALSLSPVVTGASAQAVAPVDVKAASIGADSPAKARGCVTRAEYRKVKKGMPKAKVHRIFGTAGTLVSRSGGVEARGYKGCTSRYAGVGVSYINGQLAAKASSF